jgi:hypothetical protein
LTGTRMTQPTEVMKRNWFVPSPPKATAVAASPPVAMVPMCSPRGSKTRTPPGPFAAKRFPLASTAMPPSASSVDGAGADADADGDQPPPGLLGRAKTAPESALTIVASASEDEDEESMEEDPDDVEEEEEEEGGEEGGEGAAGVAATS